MTEICAEPNREGGLRISRRRLSHRQNVDGVEQSNPTGNEIGDSRPERDIPLKKTSDALPGETCPECSLRRQS